jgi:hypothetical protein
VIIHEWFDVNLWQGELARASDSEAPTVGSGFPSSVLINSLQASKNPVF